MKEPAVDPRTVLETLDRRHPRLMLKDEELERLKQLHERDEVLQRYVKDVIKKADGLLAAPALTYDKRGPRLLHVSRECLRRVYALGLAWRWTGRQEYAQKAVENLRTVCRFPDWNPSHYLDTAEMAHAVAVGYDWLFERLDEPTREEIRAGLLRHCLQKAPESYTGPAWFVRCGHNWNQVCNGGVLIAALAVADTDAELAREIVAAAVQSLPRALVNYGPDGAWMEGPGYWHYATRYTAYALSALRSALGTDFGLADTKGLAETGTFPVYATGPTGRPLNFADCNARARRRPMACTFWLARTYASRLVAEDEHAVLARHPAHPEHVIWYVPRPDQPPPRMDLDRYFRGPVPVICLRSSWDDPDALFVGVKAGFNRVNHAHLDLGNFEIDALGVRWAVDLGSDNYNLPGYWEGKPGGRRWSYYRLNSHSHNVPLIDDTDQAPEGTSRVTKFKSDGDGARVVLDLTDAYRGQARRVTRGVALVAARRAVLVQDEFEVDGPSRITWGMTTRAEITIGNGGAARLSLQGKQLAARALRPAGAAFAVESAEQKGRQAPNKGVRRLVVRVPPVQGSATIAVLLAPARDETDAVPQVELQPLARW